MLEVNLKIFTSEEEKLEGCYRKRKQQFWQRWIPITIFIITLLTMPLYSVQLSSSDHKLAPRALSDMSHVSDMNNTNRHTMHITAA